MATFGASPSIILQQKCTIAAQDGTRSDKSMPYCMAELLHLEDVHYLLPPSRLDHQTPALRLSV